MQFRFCSAFWIWRSALRPVVSICRPLNTNASGIPSGSCSYRRLGFG
jgi:hypothetical protein